MNRALLAGTAIAAALATTAIGYRIGAGTWPSMTSAGPEASPPEAAGYACAHRAVLEASRWHARLFTHGNQDD